MLGSQSLCKVLRNAMFEPTSRYYPLPTAIHVTADGREIRYARRRFLPPGESHQTLVEVTVTEGERLDIIAARTLSNPEQFWRIADAENAMNPRQLVEEPGRTLRVPIPQVIR
jgi:hypothetical protein